MKKWCVAVALSASAALIVLVAVKWYAASWSGTEHMFHEWLWRDDKGFVMQLMCTSSDNDGTVAYIDVNSNLVVVLYRIGASPGSGWVDEYLQSSARIASDSRWSQMVDRSNANHVIIRTEKRSYEIPAAPDVAKAFRQLWFVKGEVSNIIDSLRSVMPGIPTSAELDQ
ncbi:MAG: hypothetical protein IPM64_06035 [Phycisphaerales bacterium]|nr:hypothetical protein [Phycisphaerales bacterium]